MKAEEIRSRTLDGSPVSIDRAFELEILQEIAAQLADLNAVKQQPASQGEWVKAPPTEPGCYWATRHQCVFIAEREAYDGLWHTRGREEGATDEEVKNLGWEFWSMKLEEPK